jgi:toxin ParE1/3/4
VKLVWLERSRADRRAIYAYIEVDNPRAAAMLDQRIEAAAERLIDYPNSGREGRIAGTRELVVRGSSYILPYRIEGDRVRILRVIHAARLWPEEIPDQD